MFAKMPKKNYPNLPEFQPLHQGDRKNAVLPAGGGWIQGGVTQKRGDKTRQNPEIENFIPKHGKGAGGHGRGWKGGGTMNGKVARAAKQFFRKCKPPIKPLINFPSPPVTTPRKIWPQTDISRSLRAIWYACVQQASGVAPHPESHFPAKQSRG